MEQRIRFTRTSDGVRIAYAVAGSGTPLVKAPNYLTHLEYDWDSPVWGHWLRELASGGSWCATTSVAVGCRTSTWTTSR
jgi:hypothetical protein